MPSSIFPPPAVLPGAPPLGGNLAWQSGHDTRPRTSSAYILRRQLRQSMIMFRIAAPCFVPPWCGACVSQKIVRPLATQYGSFVAHASQLTWKS